MKKMLLTFMGSCLLLMSAGCVNQVNLSKLGGAASNLHTAATLNNEDLKAMCVQMRRKGDAEATVAPARNKYMIRLTKIMGTHASVNGTPLNYKVYITKEVNANASADGSVRVYSGLMDMMNDDELRFVIGHEIGHVALGHSLKAMRLAYTTAAARQAGGAFNTTAAVLSDSMLGDLTEQFLNAQFSQSQELDADAYSMNFLKENNYNTAAAASALRKLEALGSSGGFLSSHPDPGDRAKKMDALAQGKEMPRSH